MQFITVNGVKMSMDRVIQLRKQGKLEKMKKKIEEISPTKVVDEKLDKEEPKKEDDESKGSDIKELIARVEKKTGKKVVGKYLKDKEWLTKKLEQ